MAIIKTNALLERFLDNISPCPNTGCWFWTGQLTKGGYARLRIQENLKSLFALGHVFSFWFHKGEIPKGLQVGHVCHDACKECAGGPTCVHRSCVNPDHLEVMTRKDNVNRGRGPMPGALACAAIQKAKTHCPHGHEYTPENLYQTAKLRRCRTCDRIRARIKHRKANNPHLATSLDSQDLRIRPLSRRKLVVYKLGDGE